MPSVFHRAKQMLLFIGLLSFSTFQLIKADYHEHYVMAVKQKFAIPENVQNGDYVGSWLKTLTWKSSGVSFRIENNFKNVFAINSSTGLITIANASGINGKIVRQDTLINLLIRTSDASGSEVDTAMIYVKENAFCKFIDYSYRGTETGKRDKPYNDLDDIALTPGYGYFLKRKNIIKDEYTPITGHKATQSHPTLIAAYGIGNRPAFTDGSNMCFYIGDATGGSGDPDATATQYVYFFDLYIRNYNSAAIYSRRKSNNIGFYNLIINNCDKTDVESTMVLNTSSYSDYTANYSFEVLNCRFDTTSINCSSGCEKSFIKNGVGPTKITNTYFGFINGVSHGLRLSAGHGSIVKHCVFNQGSAVTTTQNDAGIQVRQNNVRIEDCIFYNKGNGVFITNPGTIGSEAQPDYITVKNCYFKGQGLNAIHVSPVTSSDLPGVGHVFEDNLMENVANGIDLRDCSNAVIRRNTMSGGKNSAISTGGSEPSNGTLIYDNIIYDFGGKEINLTQGSNIKIFNNTVIGSISASGCSSVSTYNNYASSFEGTGTASHNLDIDTINVTMHFVNFTAHDLDIKATASSSIDKGLTTDNKIDHCGLKIINLPDIGACELKTTANNPTTDISNDPTKVPAGTPATMTGSTIYIDPSNTSDLSENGSVDHPFSSWSDVKWFSGKSYLQKRGTTAFEDKILIGADSVTIGSYGTTGELPVISSKTTTYLVSAYDKKNITISNCNIQAPDAVSALYFAGTASDNISIQHCSVTGVSNGIRVASGLHFKAQYNIINSKEEGIQSTASENQIYYNVFRNNKIAVNIQGNDAKADIINNVFYSNHESVSTTYAKLTLYNNIFYFTAEGQKAIKMLSQNISSDYNIFFPEQNSMVDISGKLYSTIDQMQKDMKIDVNSFCKDPVFADVINNNFKLDKTSPAIDRGKMVNVSVDYYNSKVPYANTTDIGIHEFTGKKSIVSDLDEASKLKVYPNPSKGTVNVDFDLLSEKSSEEPDLVQKPVVKLLDLTGKLMLRKEVNETADPLGTFDLSAYANGIYIVVLEYFGKSISKKLVLYR
ncbi:MAG TPA: right-handed parallel beta-helix repeat-containing protein [Bacteroidales bacterium]|nr:right-handed parallel beta-helix repeat-containing protein [Bacteroidales bacterium]